MARPVRCAKCGGQIGFEPRPGFVPHGQPRFYPVNWEDRTPHYKRCQLTQELAATRKPRKRPDRSATAATPQGEMFHDSKPH